MMSPQNQKSDFFTSIPSARRENGGGGMVYPDKQGYLHGIMQSPRHNSSLNDKIVHNNKIHHFFNQQGVHYNGNYLLRSKATETSTPRIDCLKNLSQISKIRLDKLQKSIRINEVVNTAHKTNMNTFLTQPSITMPSTDYDIRESDLHSQQDKMRQSANRTH